MNQNVASWVIALCGALGALAARPAGAGADESAVVGTFQAFLDGLNHRDKAAMTATLVPGGSATFMRAGKPVQLSFEALTERLSQPGSDTHDERIHDASVRVDGDIAMLWAPFEFYLNGKLEHCGTDLATLVKIDGHWLISFIGDNHRVECKGR